MFNTAIIGYLLQALDVVPKLLQAGQDIKLFVGKISDNAATMQKERRGPTPEEKAELDTLIASLRTRLHDSNIG